MGVTHALRGSFVPVVSAVHRCGFDFRVCMLWLTKSWLYVDVYLPKTQGLSPLEASDVSRMYFEHESVAGCARTS